MIFFRYVCIAGCLGAAACDRATAPAPSPANEMDAAQSGNRAAAQSIIRPSVLAESNIAQPSSPRPAPLPTAAIGFESGVDVDEAGEARLDRLLADPALPDRARFVLRGHSDSQGSDRANLDVSRRRAEAVQDYLEDKGVSTDRIEVIALGERRPIAPNAKLDGTDDPAGRARNRRVDVEVLAPEPAEAQTDEQAEGNVAMANPSNAIDPS